VSTDHVIWVKALQERVSDEKWRIDIFEAQRAEVNLRLPIQEDTQHNPMYLGEV
jgi:hypothetical protein